MSNNEDKETLHTHTGLNGETYTHTHAGEVPHKHSHSHTPKHKKAVLNRLSKAIGHLESVKHMVEDDRDCSEVLLQLFAVKSAINSTGKCILKEHLSHCIVDAVEQGDLSAVDDLNKVIDYFV
jgi:CsoR family transcriptional regulator, copper-sensing transcriptional repressor